jgi:hypothetical protein
VNKKKFGDYALLDTKLDAEERSVSCREAIDDADFNLRNLLHHYLPNEAN